VLAYEEAMSQEVDTLEVEEQPAEVVVADESQSVETEASEAVENEGEQSADAESVDPEKKPADDSLPKGVQKRIGKLTRQKYELEERLRQQEERLKALEARPKQQEAPKSQSDFATQEEYLEHLADKKVQEKLEAQQAELVKKSEEGRKLEEATQKWQSKVAQFAENVPDFVEVVSETDVALPFDVVETIQESDYGAEIIYELSKNPEKAKALTSNNQRVVDLALLKLELEIENRQATAEPPVKKEVTQAQATPKAKGTPSAPVPLEKLRDDDYLRAYRESKRKK
jgi:hypothetical protein